MLNKHCSVCRNLSFREVFYFKDGYMSDGAKVGHPLIKEECTVCGTVRTKANINWNEFYENTYSPSRNIDTVVLDKNEREITRSEFVHQWMVSLLNEAEGTDISSVLEIGCGQGYLLEKLEIRNKFGVEASKQASEIAGKVANVRNIMFEKIDDLERYDLVVSYCVIEHLEEPEALLKKSFNILNDEGIMLIALPVQDRFNYDLLFIDHLYHFSHRNFEKLLKSNGFDILNYELGRDSYSNIGMYICRKNGASFEDSFLFEENRNIQNVNKILENIKEIIARKSHDEFFAFGFGEIAKTIIPYTQLDSVIKYYIDDYTQADKVVSTFKAKELIKNLNNTVAMILLVNPKHEKKVKHIFNDHNNIDYIIIFEGIDLEYGE